jgi:hypothetical protein
MSKAISLGDVFTIPLRVLLGNRCFTKAICAIGGTKSMIKTTTNTVQYCIDGIAYEKAPTDDLFVFTDLAVQPISTTCYYALCLDKSGNGSIVNGTPVLTASITAGTAAAVIPEVASTLCVIGAVKVVTDGTGTFVPATDGLDDGAVTDTYFNLSCVPVNSAP